MPYTKDGVKYKNKKYLARGLDNYKNLNILKIKITNTKN